MTVATRRGGGNPWANVTFAERFNAKWEYGPSFDGTRCWDWRGTATKKGYGSIYRNGKRTMAHRAAYEEWVGPIPEGLEIDHLCRRPCCVNPLHLEPVTRSVNQRRGTGFAASHAAQTHCKRGHEFTESNTYVSSRGERICRKCKAAKEYGRRHGLTIDEAVALREGQYGHVSIDECVDDLADFRLERL